MKRKSNTITKQEDIDYFLNLTVKDMEKLSFIMENFGRFNGKQKFQPYDLITIPAGAYGNEKKHNTKPFVTTLGLWVYNRVFIEPDFLDILGYINKPIDDDVTSDINQEITYAVMEDRVSLDALKRYIMREQKFQPYSNILCSSFSKEMLLSSTRINKKKKELQKKYKEQLDKNDPKAAIAIEKELLAYSKEILKDDKAMDMYTSGAKGSFKNNFKNLFVIRGAIKDPDPTKGYDIVDSNYIDGIKKKDYAAMAKSLAAGPFARARKTMLGGYWEKLFLRSFQHIKLLPQGSDCHTDRTITITLNKKNIRDVMYSYIKEGNKLIELTSQNKDKYIGKTVQIRFASLCESKEGICSKCIGNFFYRLGITNVGVTTPQVASRLKVISMKSFHDCQVSMYEIDPDKIFED